MEVLHPRRYPNNKKRAAATRTILQPEIDRYGEAEAAPPRHQQVANSSSQNAFS